MEQVSAPPATPERSARRVIRLEVSKDESEVKPTESYDDKLLALRAELESKESEAGSVTIYGVALMYVAALPANRYLNSFAWIIGTFTLVVLELFTLQSVAIGSVWTKCLYDDDCQHGKVCVSVKPVGRDRYSMQSICVGCSTFINGERGSDHNLADDSPLGKFVQTMIDPVIPDAVLFTPARTNDRWPVANSPHEYCSNQLDDDAVASWYNRTTDRDYCLHVLEAMACFGALDLVVLIVACLLVCSSISRDRQQQLYCRHLRKTLMPPPWRSWRCACFVVIDILCSALLPSVTLAMVLLVFGGSLKSADVLLNGVAIAFVLVVDDELPDILIPQTDMAAIDKFVTSVGDHRTMINIKRKGTCTGFVYFCAIIIMLVVGSSSTCDMIGVECIGVVIIAPIIARFMEELIALFYTALAYRSDRSKAPSSRGSATAGQDWSVQSAATNVANEATIAETAKGIVDATVAECSWRNFVTRMLVAVLEGVSTSCVVAVVCRFALNIYLHAGAGSGTHRIAR